ncbi:cytochrome c biogenesis protein CcdA [Maridesulfovibrio sp.]|uniref:protein-disulfide reductase DsbD family protein n=1 Tax=Maridesulfovibrio sp. TaxID=2795000 RepID=UPI002A18703D|nr:cytochrome c biogenesis protein CcdA [Maridesulfovibrio sp.]
MRLKLILFVLLSFISLTVLIAPQPACSAENQNPNLSTSWKLYRLSPDSRKASGIESDILAALVLTPQNGWYTYSHTPGKMGQPTTLKVTLIPGKTVISPIYLPGKIKDDPFNKGGKIETYPDATPILIPIPDTHKTFTLNTQLSLLMCSDTACQPYKDKFNFIGMGVAKEKLPAANAQKWWPDFLKAVQDKDGSRILLKDMSAQLKKKPVAPGVEQKTQQQTLPEAVNAETAHPEEETTAQFKPEKLTPKPFTPGLEVTNLSTAIFFGLLAGLLLNFMPCVLPVISLKLSTLMAGAKHENREEQKRSFREHNIFFALGILIYFGLLSGILGATGMAWGQIFQKPPVVIALAGIVFALSLSLFGLFNLPVVDLKISAEKGGPRRQALFTGILATLLATPCSGPFLGGVLGWAMVQKHYVIGSVFLSVGTGMALPYILMAIFPALAARFPKPGAWTIWIERAAGFFLCGTCIYLLSILPENMFIPALIFMWFTAVGAWMWGLAGSSDTRSSMYLLRIAALVLCVSVGFWASIPPERSANWIAFEQNDFSARLGRDPLLVEFTADWCPSCKVLEQTALTPANLNRWQEEYGLTFIKVDLTLPDKRADAFLRALGSRSIPLAAIFGTGNSTYSPTVIRDLYTSGQMDDALRQTLK